VNILYHRGFGHVPSCTKQDIAIAQVWLAIELAASLRVARRIAQQFLAFDCEAWATAQHAAAMDCPRLQTYRATLEAIRRYV
jgi:hypothetical protein